MGGRHNGTKRDGDGDTLGLAHTGTGAQWGGRPHSSVNMENKTKKAERKFCTEALENVCVKF